MPPLVICPSFSPTSCPVAQVFVATASDACSPANHLNIACTPSAYDAFDFAGVSAGVCIGIDLMGNQAACQFQYPVVDNAPPTLRLPSSVDLVATDGQGVLFSYVVTATDGCSLNSLTCLFANDTIAPVAGRLSFPVASTTSISCTATNDAGLTAYGTFTVSVRAR